MFLHYIVHISVFLSWLDYSLVVLHLPGEVLQNVATDWESEPRFQDSHRRGVEVHPGSLSFCSWGRSNCWTQILVCFILGFPFIHLFSCEVCILYLIRILYIVYYFSFLSFIFQELWNPFHVMCLVLWNLFFNSLLCIFKAVFQPLKGPFSM